jgi:hypothetical protein
VSGDANLSQETYALRRDLFFNHKSAPPERLVPMALAMQLREAAARALFIDLSGPERSGSLEPAQVLLRGVHTPTSWYFTSYRSN